ncbi:GFA family protein [Paracoccus sp. pheM1]|nr:GFA family protein [Paracoccus sp. pheM1]
MSPTRQRSPLGGYRSAIAPTANSWPAAPFAGPPRSPREAFRLTGAAPRCSVKVADNGKRRRQFFCPECGSPICTTGEGAETEEIGIRVGTVNQRDQLTPTSQIWCGSALPWLGEIPDLPGRPRD